MTNVVEDAMFFRKLSVFLVFCLAIILSSCGGSGEASAVKKAFESYRSALLNQDGKAAVEAVSSNTIKMYQEYRDQAMTGDEQSVKGLSIVNRMQVLLMRHRIDPKLLKKMDGNEVFAYAVDQNWIGKNSVVRLTLEDVAVSGPRATAKASADGKQTGERFHFVREEGSWKLDLGPTIQATDQVMQGIARKKGMSENELVFSLITSVSGRQVTEAIWRPLE
jgi:hypothetical protein